MTGPFVKPFAKGVERAKAVFLRFSNGCLFGYIAK